MRIGFSTNTENETIWLKTSHIIPDPDKVMALNRGHRGFEIMLRDKDVTCGENQLTNWLDYASRNILNEAGCSNRYGIERHQQIADQGYRDSSEHPKQNVSWLTKNHISLNRNIGGAMGWRFC